ncbi:Oidioi.mRNA.OKI2018_I69.XSR.g16224.t1.cds [Oikopleura dioica]|uniref:Oidioi.mRNA.OKI2018_I69.XSR.g16224.t1.cds n=1 Tax=Oikopleura dioica TaxID=34765 RepID=A0ABN7SKI1_OIKDI|nr:Oidioi.mRNA.OKI2018_I69.XSR.g16224.t1.cds [Oikopleura dioica]
MIFAEYVQNIPLVSIFYARFHETKGAIIEYTYPEGSFPQPLQTFSKKLLIPKDELMGKVITLRTSLEDEEGKASQYKIINCPVMVENNARYTRYQFKFNFGFILKWDYDKNAEEEPSTEYFRSSPFAPLVKKLAEDMRKIENEEQWLSNVANENDESNGIPQLLENMFVGLRKDGFVNIPVGLEGRNEIYLRVFPPTVLPNEVRVHHVPVLLDEKIQRLEYADLTVQEMIGRIDGINHIKKICGEHHRDMTPQIACLTIRDLCFAGVCRLDRIFKFSNRYRTTEKLDELYKAMLLRNPESEIAVYELSSIETTGSDFSDISIDYSEEDEDEHPMLCDVLQYHTAIAQNCDVRNLIQHAMLKEYIYLVEEYPALRKRDRFSEGSDHSVTKIDQRVELLTSAFSVDEICAHLNLSPTLLKQEFSRTFHDRLTYFFK